jgi:superfamily I DNA/RNA helicase
VVVALTPNKAANRDNATLDVMFHSPMLSGEEPEKEFTRMYYVACSRAKEDLYIHLPSGFNFDIIDTALTTFSAKSRQKIEYERIC